MLIGLYKSNDGKHNYMYGSDPIQELEFTENNFSFSQM